VQGIWSSPGRGPGRRTIPAPRVPPVRLRVLSVQPVRMQAGRVSLVSAGFPKVGRTRFIRYHGVFECHKQDVGGVASPWGG
jgi:hypothetical protein